MGNRNILQKVIQTIFLGFTGWFFFWSFIYDSFWWNKNLYQCIESEAYNIFYLLLCTLGLLALQLLYPRVLVVNAAISHVKTPEALSRESPHQVSEPHQVPEAPTHPFIAAAKLVAEGDKP